MAANIDPVATLPSDVFCFTAWSSSPCRIHGKASLVKISVDRNGKKKGNGKPKSLKRSGEYPLQFGLALAALIHPTGEPSPSPEWGHRFYFFFGFGVFLESHDYHIICWRNIDDRSNGICYSKYYYVLLGLMYRRNYDNPGLSPLVFHHLVAC